MSSVGRRVIEDQKQRAVARLFWWLKRGLFFGWGLVVLGIRNGYLTHKIAGLTSNEFKASNQGFYF